MGFVYPDGSLLCTSGKTEPRHDNEEHNSRLRSSHGNYVFNLVTVGMLPGRTGTPD